LRPLAKIEKRNIVIAIAVTILLVVVDQVVKVIAARGLRGQPSFSYLGNFITFEYAENRGAFLSLGASLSETGRFWIFVIGVFFILGFCVWSLVKSLRHTPSVVALALVIAGGIGNLIDRVVQGYVVDYVHMGLFGLRTGVFNVADIAISGGLLLLVGLQYSPGAEEAAKAEVKARNRR
jgi:signal peptidase II